MIGNLRLASLLPRRVSPRVAAVLVPLLLSACQTNDGETGPALTPNAAPQPVKPAPVLPRSTYRPAGEAQSPAYRCAKAYKIPDNDSFAKKSCAESEAGYSDLLKKSWARVTDDDIRACEARVIGEVSNRRSYSALAMYNCIKDKIRT